MQKYAEYREFVYKGFLDRIEKVAFLPQAIMNPAIGGAVVGGTAAALTDREDRPFGQKAKRVLKGAVLGGAFGAGAAGVKAYKSIPKVKA
jgi:hypothetical protein